MSTNRIATYKEFFPFYLREHSKKLTRGLHYTGTSIALALLAWTIATQTWWALPFYPVIGYGFAWYAHFFVEHNRPATFTYPLWSLAGDHHMFALFLSGGLKKRLGEAGVLV
ncbi:MAG: DUF962 domain-containing protein [Alphaproteobacteria bacterium]|nr:MAG: DUF962 domain-containing protein [Alphaproteobacteria bacterium]